MTTDAPLNLNSPLPYPASVYRPAGGHTSATCEYPVEAEHDPNLNDISAASSAGSGCG